MFHRTRAAFVAATLAVGLVPAVPAQAATSNDAYVDDLWGLDQINVDGAWGLSTGGGVTVAVIDSGVDLDHPDLSANVVRGATFLAGCDTSCGDGDWQSGPDNPDGVAHGTHVAGTIAAVGGNGVGVVGVAPDATILPIRVLDDAGSATDDEIVRGIDWAVANGADVINMSLGKLPGIEQLEQTIFVSEVAEAVDRATAAGVVVVIAAGNDTYPFCASPAAFDGAICVTAVDYFGTPSYYSNGAIKDDQMAVAAPGGGGHFCDLGILSTVPVELGDDPCLDRSGGYAFMNGTSMATPHVAGAAAQLVAMGCSRDQVHELLRTTSFTPLLGTGIWDPQYGYGIIDTAAATAAALTLCSSTQSPTSTPVAGDEPKGRGNGGGPKK